MKCLAEKLGIPRKMKNGIVGENKEGEGKEDDEQGEGTTKKA